MSGRTSRWAAWGFLAPVTVYLALFSAYPLYKNLDLSLRDYTVMSFVHGGAPFAGLANYRTFFPLHGTLEGYRADEGGARQPITLGIYHYIGNNDQQWNAIMATAVVASVPATVLLVLAQRYVAAGITTDAVKD